MRRVEWSWMMAPGLCSKTDGRPAACQRCQDKIRHRAQSYGLLCGLHSEREREKEKEHAPSSCFLPRAEGEKAGGKGESV